MFKGISTAEAFEQCMKRGLCENHIKEINQNELAFPLDEIPRKTFLYIRVNILYTILFNKATKSQRIKILLQKTPIFSRVLAKGDASEAADAILILDSVVVFILCHFSKICCIGAIFDMNVNSEDPQIKLLQNLLFVDRFDGSILYQLFPVLEKNFDGFDKDLIKISYVITLLFVRSACVKLDIKRAVKDIKNDLEISPQWENCKSIGDDLYQKGNYKDACSTYTAAVMLNSYSSALFTQRAHTYLKLGKFKAAQLDAYISVALDPKWCEGYYVFSSSLFHQKLYQEAFNITKYGLAACEQNKYFYDTLQAFHNEIETKYINKEPSNNISENSVNPDLANIPLPEKKYFPVLVDSDSEDSETEACQKNFPELVDSTDSDESENMEEKIKLTPTKNKTKKKRIIPENSSNGIVTEMDIDKIRTYLKEASEAVLSDCGYKAVQIFRGPLRDFIDSPKLKTFEECEIVCIKYAYGIAYYKSGGYDDLLKCITILKEIIEKHDSITFPAASYALGLTYHKLNRFKEALGYLETVQNFLCKGIHFKVYSWPEILTVIEETKPNILKVCVSDLIKECENPPNADALCRFADCSYQPTIYYSDPDFKGYMSLFCSEQCCLQYHLQCWKIMKAEKNLTDKEFLEAACFTPDCDGVIIKIQHIDKKGDLTKEFISDFKKPGKLKWAKWEKKTDAKEKKKKRANSKCEDGSVEGSNENGKTSSRKNSDANDKFIPVQASGTIIPPDGNDTSTSENILVSLEKSNSSELNVGSKISDNISSSVNSVKESKDIIYISDINESSNFQKTTYYYDSEERKVVSSMKTSDVTCILDKDKASNSMQETTVTSHFQNESQCISREVQNNSSQYQASQCIKENLYSFMNDFLQHHGPLKIDDPLVTDEMASFPDECNSMISECGGIGEFLKNDLRFAFVGDSYICVISDMATAYRMNSNSLQSDIGSFQSLESTDNPQFFNEHHLSFSLNPDAVEYTPVVSSHNGQKEDHRTDNSVENLNYISSVCKAESSEILFTTNAISENQNDKSESCDTVMDPKLNNSDIIFEQTQVNGSQEGNEELSNKASSQAELNSETPNLDDENYNQNFIEDNENLCDVDDLSPSHVTVETVDHIDLNEDSKLKELLLLLPDLKEYCDKDFEKYHKYINDSLKPYAIRKVSKTDFECTVEDTNSNSLKAKNKELEEENLSLKKQLISSNKDVEKLSDEVYGLKINLSCSSFDIEALKIDFKKKEETLQNGREYLIKSLTQAHSSIDEQKKRIELLEGLNTRHEETVDKLTSSVNEAEEKMKIAVKDEEKKQADIIKNLQDQNEELKNRLKCAEVQFLQTKKAEFLKRIEDKFLDVSRKKQELARGLTLMSGNLNPVVQSSMKAIFSQFSSYEEELKTLRLEFVKNIDKQIEKVEKGTPLKELKDIELKKIPDLPHLQSLTPEFDKNPLNSSPMPFNVFNMPSWPQIPSIIPTPTVSSSTIPQTTIIPPANPLAAVIKPGLSSAIPTAKPAVAVIPQAIPSATIIPQSASSVKIPQTVPSGSIIPHATPSTKILQPSAEPSHITHSVLASVIPDIGTSPKKSYDSLETKIKEPLRNSGISINAFSSFPYSVPTLDKEFNKTCEIFKPPDSAPNKKSDTFKAPPGIVNSANNLVSSRTASNSSKDSLETFPSGAGAIGTVDLASYVSSIESSVNELLMNSSEEKLVTQKRAGSSYERLLQKLKEQFPSCSQEELLSLVKEFRSRRQGKLTGLPIDTIVKELRTIINSRKAAEKKIIELKMQTKANKILVNKKLVIDSKASSTTEPPPSIKKKSAWNTIETDCKTFSGNLDDDCTICCDPMTPASAYKVACGHTFHEQCIRQWLTRKSDCPVCRVLLLLPEEYPSLK